MKTNKLGSAEQRFVGDITLALKSHYKAQISDNVKRGLVNKRKKLSTSQNLPCKALSSIIIK